MIACGIDTGATTGVAVLEIEGARALWIDGFTTREHPLDTPLVQFADELDLFAVEEIAGYAHGERALAKTKHLIAASKLAGEMIGWARERGLRVVTAPASAWRKAIIGRRCPSDALIKRVLQTRIEDLPRCSAHVRDACVAALAGAQSDRLQGMQRGARS